MKINVHLLASWDLLFRDWLHVWLQSRPISVQQNDITLSQEKKKWCSELQLVQVLFPRRRINGLSPTFWWRRHSAQEAAAGWSAGTSAAPQEGTGHHRGQPYTPYTALPRTKSHVMVHRSSQSRWIITMSSSPFWKLSGRFSMTLGSSQLWSPWWGFCPQQGLMAFFATTKLRGRQGCSPIRSVPDRPPTCEPM